MRIIPNVPPKVFTGSAVVIGYLLMDDTTANEQNALGNWLMLVAQVLCTNAIFKQLQAEREAEVNNNNNSNNTDNFDTKESIIMLEKMVKALNTEIENLKKEINK